MVTSEEVEEGDIDKLVADVKKEVSQVRALSWRLLLFVSARSSVSAHALPRRLSAGKPMMMVQRL